MRNESWMWETLDKAMKNRWRAERMESKFAPGLADVCFTVFPCAKHECSWMELKVAYQIDTFYVDAPVKLPHYNAAQKDWLTQRRKMGQPVYFMLYCVPTDEWVLLDGKWRDGRDDLPGELFQWLGTSMSIMDIYRNSPWRSKTLADFPVSTLTDLLSDYSRVTRVLFERAV
jgi:hypothetical protein